MWLKAGPYTRCLAKQINARKPLTLQIGSATCVIDDNHITDLLELDFIREWGTSDAPAGECFFIGNVFLHPEEEKRRWRLIFHPEAFNTHVKMLRLQSTKLPRLRRILKQISSAKCTIKLDLKCAFFQIGISPGLFVFKRGVNLFTLTRLPMGSSVSVMIAQHLSLQVADRILGYLRQVSAAVCGEFNVFVDDIFVSFDPVCDDTMIEKLVLEAVQRTEADLGVTFKFCHIYVGGTSLMATSADEENLPPRPPEHRNASERCAAPPLEEPFFKLVESLEVLGVVFQPRTGGIRLKDAFKLKLSAAYSKLSFNNVSSKKVWEFVGSCFFVIYAIGISPSRFYGVFRCLSRLAKLLGGARRFDPMWDQQVHLTPSETSALHELRTYVLTFPTNTFEPSGLPSRFLFTDASNDALGVSVAPAKYQMPNAAPETVVRLLAQRAMPIVQQKHLSTIKPNPRPMLESHKHQKSHCTKTGRKTGGFQDCSQT